jgi:hypothetical protein
LFKLPVGCWDKSENKYDEYSAVLEQLQADLTPNARTEEELAAIDERLALSKLLFMLLVTIYA